MITIEDVHNMHETFIQNHATRMTEPNTHITSINHTTEATTTSQLETDVMLDQIDKDLNDLLNSL